MAVDSSRLRILQLNADDSRGGAAGVAWNLFATYRGLGHASYLAVGNKRTTDSDVIAIAPKATHAERALPRQVVSSSLRRLQERLPVVGRARYWLGTLAAGPPAWERALGWEDFNFPYSRHLLDLLPEHPNIVHAHNLHGGYFDLRYLPELSAQVPLMLTLHDAWLLSGHCAHSFDCWQWMAGCGHCPDLSIYPAIPRDATTYNWRRKQKIYRESRLYVSTPCHWLMEKVERSMLMLGCRERRVIPNGIDLNVFRPGDQAADRRALNLPLDARIVLFVANGSRQSIWRDYQSMREAITSAAERLAGRPVLFLALGEDGPAERAGAAEVRFTPWQTRPEAVAAYYRAADVYLHGARADTFPTVVLEALACGTPVVATAVGGIPEQIKQEETGFLVPQTDGSAMATALERLLNDESLARSMGAAAADDARARFRLERQVQGYLTWYAEILETQAKEARG